MEEANQKCPETFESLIVTVKTKMYKTAISVLKNDEDACDAIQEALLSAYKSFDTLQNKEYFSTWIIRILLNKCYNIIQKNKKVTYLNEQSMINENDRYYDFYSVESNVEKTLNQIDSDLKLVAVLYYYDEFSVKEISELLTIPEGTVKSRLSRAREKIYDILRKEEGENNG